MVFFFNEQANPEIYTSRHTLSLRDDLQIESLAPAANAALLTSGSSLVDRTMIGISRVVGWLRYSRTRLKPSRPGITRSWRITVGLMRTDRKSTRLNSVTNAHLVCCLLLEQKKHTSV